MQIYICFSHIFSLISNFPLSIQCQYFILALLFQGFSSLQRLILNSQSFDVKQSYSKPSNQLKIQISQAFSIKQYVMSSLKMEQEIAQPALPLKKGQTASKQEYESLWQIIFVIVSVASAVLANKVYLYQTIEDFENYRKGSIINLLAIGLPFALLFGYIDHKIHQYFDPLCDKYYVNHEKFPDPEVRKKRCFTLVKWGYSLLYYAISSSFAYYLLFNTDTLPVWLGGSGSCMNIYRDSPRMPAYSFGMELFYILQFGKHFSRTFCHCFVRSEGNFFQYALHHGLSTFLIVFSFLMNFWIVGVFVLFLHDISDFFLILSRAYREARNRKEWLLQSFYFSTFIVWIGSRIVVFCSCCIYPSLSFIISEFYRVQLLSQKMRNVMFAPCWFMAIMLVILQVLQLFWTYYIARSFLATSVSKKLATHNYD